MMGAKFVTSALSILPPTRDADRQQLLAGWQSIAQGLVGIKVTAREVRAVRSLLSSRLAPVADILGIHTAGGGNCGRSPDVVSSGRKTSRSSKHHMDTVGYLHLRGKNPPTWYVSYSVNALSPEGEPIRKRVQERIGPVTELTEQQARARKNEILLRAGAGPLVGPRPIAPTVAEFVEQRFLPEHVALLKKAGRLHYRTYLKNHVLPGIGSLKLKDVDHEDIQRLVRLKQQAKPHLVRIKERLPETLSPQTLRHIRNVCCRRRWSRSNGGEARVGPRVALHDYKSWRGLLAALPDE